MYNSFELFFFWRKCSTVVAVGVQTSFLLLCKKCDRKKTTAGLIVRRQAKRLCKPRGTRGEDFCLPGFLPSELPVINFQAKPDRFHPNSIFHWSFAPNPTYFFVLTPKSKQKRSRLRPPLSKNIRLTTEIF